MVPIRLGVSEEFLIWGELSPHNVSEFPSPKLAPSIYPAPAPSIIGPSSDLPSKLHKELPLALAYKHGKKVICHFHQGQPTRENHKEPHEIDGKGFLSLPMKGISPLFPHPHSLSTCRNHFTTSFRSSRGQLLN